MRKIYNTIIFAILINSCDKAKTNTNDFRDNIVGSYNVVREEWNCVDGPPNYNYIGPHIVNTSRLILKVDKYGELGLNFSDISYPIEQLNPANTSFQGLYRSGTYQTGVEYLALDSISIYTGRIIGCHGSDAYYHYHGKK
jgi:hypothetical protein